MHLMVGILSMHACMHCVARSTQTDIKGAERDATFKSGRARDVRTQGPAPDASVGGLTGMDVLGSHHPDELPPPGQEVLYFEFVDGDLDTHGRTPFRALCHT